MAQLSFSSYCPELHDGKLNTSVCTTDKQGTPCPGLGDIRTTAEFVGGGTFDMGGFVAVDKAQRSVILAFKGTDTPQELLQTDLSVRQVKRLVSSVFCLYLLYYKYLFRQSKQLLTVFDSFHSAIFARVVWYTEASTKPSRTSRLKQKRQLWPR